MVGNAVVDAGTHDHLDRLVPGQEEGRPTVSQRFDVQPRLTRAGTGAQGATAGLLAVSDFNGDGVPDLQVWQDNNGVYNVPVHAFYLFDAKRNRYVRAKALEAAIGGRDIDHIDNGRFVLRAKVSPCEREDKVIQLRGTEPRTLLQRRYDTCKGEAPTESDLLK